MAFPKITPKTAVAMYISPGILVGAGGIMIINGRIVKVPPRGPVFEQLVEVLNKIANGKG
jgi:hypothetical protein